MFVSSLSVVLAVGGEGELRTEAQWLCEVVKFKLYGNVMNDSHGVTWCLKEISFL
jgi:hypothetical protein